MVKGGEGRGQPRRGPKKEKAADNVKVVVRCRPLSEREEADKRQIGLAMDLRRGTIQVQQDGARDSKPWSFDAIYDWTSIQRQIFDDTAMPLIDAVLEGFNATIFAYGQTGTGKTFTMEGVRSKPELRGIMPNTFEHIFRHIDEADGQKQFLVTASYLEIYMEQIRDLLSKDQKKHLTMGEKESGVVYVKNLSSFVVKSATEIEHVMGVGNKNRSVGVTDMNAHSSRSHAIFIITVECSEIGEDGEAHIRVGKLNLVDLAGSERQAKTKATGQRLKEATKINMSLSTLGLVINSLVEGRPHIPYRDSTLTRLLQDSLGGNAKTLMIAAIGPSDHNTPETINTLRYANSAKNIKNKPKINEDPQDALLREFQDEIARLKEQLANRGSGGKKRRKKKKKRKHKEPRYTEDGELIEESDSSESEGGEEGLTEEEQNELIRQEREKLEVEKQAMLQDHSILKEEKDRLLGEMEHRDAEMAERQEANRALSDKIAAMESKLLRGGKTVEEYTSDQEKALRKKRREIEKHEARKRELEERRAKKEAKRLEMEETYKSKQEEVSIKTRKLKKVWAQLQDAKEDIEDAKDEFEREQDDLQQTMDDLQRELKLKQFIIDQFVPPEEVRKVEDRALFDEALDQWRLAPRSTQGLATYQRPVCAAPRGRRAITQHARLRANLDQNPRYRAENVFLVELDLPDRTTLDYTGPTVAPRVQTALDDALRDEEDLTLEATPEDFLDNAIRHAKRAQRQQSSSTSSPRPSTGRRRPGGSDTPESRRLVSRSKRYA